MSLVACQIRTELCMCENSYTLNVNPAGSSALCPGIQGEQQCCTDSYLMNTAEVRSMQAFREALSSELDNRLQEFDQITTRVDTCTLIAIVLVWQL